MTPARLTLLLPLGLWLLACALLVVAGALGWAGVAEAAGWAFAALSLFLPGYAAGLALLRGRPPRARLAGALLLPVALFLGSLLVPVGRGGFFARGLPLGVEGMLRLADAGAGLSRWSGRAVARAGRVASAEPGAPAPVEGPAPRCRPVTCKLYCQAGFARDAEGCPVCACAPGR